MFNHLDNFVLTTPIHMLLKWWWQSTRKTNNLISSNTSPSDKLACILVIATCLTSSHNNWLSFLAILYISTVITPPYPSLDKSKLLAKGMKWGSFASNKVECISIDLFRSPPFSFTLYYMVSTTVLALSPVAKILLDNSNGVNIFASCSWILITRLVYVCCCLIVPSVNSCFHFLLLPKWYMAKVCTAINSIIHVQRIVQMEGSSSITVVGENAFT